jgi:small nuclear ribonucleoprotein (snRNP)-like protein
MSKSSITFDKAMNLIIHSVKEERKELSSEVYEMQKYVTQLKNTGDVIAYNRAIRDVAEMILSKNTD